jgi:hypothetical protein
MEMANATTAAAEQQAAKQKADAEEREAQFIFVTCFLNARRNAEILQKEAIAKFDAKSPKHRALADAMWAGSNELRNEARTCLKSLMYRGQLLFAFDGTTVPQGGAA